MFLIINRNSFKKGLMKYVSIQKKCRHFSQFQNTSTIDAQERAKFSGVDWNSAIGKALADMHQTRMGAIDAYLQNKHLSLDGLRVADIGCGGGLLSSSLLERGAEVVAVDIVQENVDRTLERSRIVNPLGKIEGRVSTVEELLATEGRKSFDVVLSLEVLEHVNNPSTFVSSCVELAKEALVLSTINRTFQSYALAILAAEYVTGMVPVGTHNWFKFVQPKEIEDIVHARMMHTDALVGMVFNPVTKSWSTSDHLFDVNYLYFASKFSSNRK